LIFDFHPYSWSLNYFLLELFDFGYCVHGLMVFATQEWRNRADWVWMGLIYFTFEQAIVN